MKSPQQPLAVPSKAVVVFSGGQDSTTCLIQALAQYDEVHAITFNYGQRHSQEIAVAQTIAAELGVTAHKVLDLGLLNELAISSLTRDAIPVSTQLQENGLPNTFVPGRNLIFLVAAAALADRRGLEVLIGGMCETDYSGYPDCRNDTIQATARALSLGLDKSVPVETPLMFLTKAQTWELADQIGGRVLVKAIIEFSHTCYLGDRTHRHVWGYGCGACPACELRAAGYAQWARA